MICKEEKIRASDLSPSQSTLHTMGQFNMLGPTMYITYLVFSTNSRFQIKYMCINVNPNCAPALVGDCILHHSQQREIGI